ncbi:glycerophosphodiester phosphodiesterase family protein [Listeria monocytogenes]|nr:glycerophosphodiester phosphodiesterase family protein [Listeria monocytogenes]
MISFGIFLLVYLNLPNLEHGVLIVLRKEKRRIKYSFSVLTLVIITLAACGIQTTNTPEFFNTDNFMVSAHRGAVKYAPENTIESIRKADELNYLSVEIDPRLSKDDNLYLMHDETVDRTTNGKGKIQDLSSEYIDSLKVNTDNYDEYIEQIIKVPKFEEAVKEISKTNMIVNIDCSKIDVSIKENADQIVNILTKYRMYNRSFFVISDKIQRDNFIGLYNDACVSWLYDGKNDLTSEIVKLQDYKNSMLSIDVKYATKSNLDILNSNDIFYQVYKVEDIEKAKYLKSTGVKMIETDSIVPNQLD